MDVILEGRPKVYQERREMNQISRLVGPMLVFVVALTTPRAAWSVGGEGLLVPLENWTVLSDAAAAKTVPRHAPAVLLIPGMLAGDDTMSAIRYRLRESAIPTAMFRYDSQLGVERVATRLAKLIRAEADRLPSRQITLVTHSMGGVVARRVVEDPAWDCGVVNQLVMIAPPNGGSSLAGLGGDDLKEVLSAIRGNEVPTVIDQKGLSLINETVDLFLGNAKKDLAPGSETLRRMDTLDRNPAIRYSILAGTGGPVPPVARGIGQMVIEQLLADPIEGGEGLKKVLEVADRDEWIRGLGDGVVTVRSTRLRGVDDHQELAFAHNDASESPDYPATRELVDEVMRRLPKP
jgi:pimeloyl-ACP methyl ester carboxylesterase